MTVETHHDLDGLRRAGRVVALALQAMRERVRPGITTKELDDVGWAVLKRHGARPAPLLTYRFPGVACISVNEEAAHGIPGSRVLHSGDLVKLDMSIELDTFWADAAITVPVGEIRPRHRDLCDAARAAFQAGASVARAGTPVHTVGAAVDARTRALGFHVIRELPGHGIGRALHEPPSVPNYARTRSRERLTEGLVVTIEPHIAEGSGRLITHGDGWTLATRDGGFAAAYEHTVIITRGDPILVTAL
ncbi:MAG: Methionine aminopeptidase [uncultured Chloroflexia bacterium]|uniref:Methionine aminopeptidase n=1 Tax=uncultured Chloroflexia bacterium TaxID=1672391 RepID=A0A6J4M2P0_9CHLR|nr:MAG: Methionine aminopeptidase [uncultured Chloroflexia bacterium]